MTKNQTAIESLSLITDPSCSGNQDKSAPAVMLESFSHLKHFSWKGLRSARDLRSLYGLLKTNRKTLKELCLDFVDMNIMETIWDEKHTWSVLSEEDRFLYFLAENILAHEEAGPIQLFSSLITLSLSACPIQGPTTQLIHALNISQLQSLILHKCPGLSGLLSAVIDSAIVLKLKHLEIISYDEPAYYYVDLVLDDIPLEALLIQLLESFEGLESLYITIEPQEPSIHCWEAIDHHR